jgi:putative thioredoxin
MNEPKKHLSPWIIETTDSTFERDVIQRSQSQLVVVDFWSPSCQPCRLLAPILEKLAAEYAGKFLLVKVETEKVPRAAWQLNVYAIPAVFGFVGGEAIDGFQGLLPEDQLRKWIDRLLSASELREAKRLEDTDPSAAEAKYRELAEQSPNDATAQIGLARVLLAQERFDEARALIAALAQRGDLEPEAEKVKAVLELKALKGGDVGAARAAAAARPDDLDLQFQLAKALLGAQLLEEAFEVLLSLVQRDKAGRGEQARQLMVDVFRTLPDDSELVGTYRRKLSMALY